MQKIKMRKEDIHDEEILWCHELKPGERDTNNVEKGSHKL